MLERTRESSNELGHCSFEDSLVLSNIDWFKALEEEVDPITAAKVKHRGTLAKVIGLVLDYPDHAELLKELHAMLRGSFSKGDFAATLFERLNAGQDLKCPAYITDALTWLSGQLNVTAGETP